MELYDTQISALKRMRNGCILKGGVGSGKSRTGLMYYFTRILEGDISVNQKGQFRKPLKDTPLYIITVAKKRDSLEWESEMAPFLLSTNESESINHIKVVIDSWNNIQKYTGINNAFFIFDEQRAIGSGQWSKSFIKIAKANEWIVLSATPGDTWKDYIPIFIANGFYKNRTEFCRNHIIYDAYCTKYPKIKGYVNVKRLENLKNLITVEMGSSKRATQHHENIIVNYDRILYTKAMKDRWNPFKDEPIQQVSELCYVLRRVSNISQERRNIMMKLIGEHPKSIIFYNFDYELELLKELIKEMNIPFAEYNGHKHEPIPKKSQWVYLVQYSAGAEAWNCIETDTIIFYSQNYSYRTMIQAAGRIDRTNTPFMDLYYYHIRSSSKIDMAIYKALKQKKNFNENIYFKY